MKNEKLEFFLVALPGLEDVVLAELKEWFPTLEAKTEHGGVTVHAPMSEGLSMNLALKTPTRILLRLDSFRCKDFPKLYNKIAEFPWPKWVNPACELDVQVSTRLSRLKIKSRIEETCMDGWISQLKKNGVIATRGKKLSLFVRFLEDVCTLSLDTSGERLHKRGTREHVGEAPLRETIAAALIHMVASTHAAPDQVHEPVEIIDPMMGSGTFLLEAAERDRLVEKREFAFENFAQHETVPPVLRTPRPRIGRLVGYEKDKKALTAARHNLAKVKPAPEVHAIDFFQAEPLGPAAGTRWLFCNPPYGERIKVKEPLADLYAKLFAAAETIAQPDRACFLLPAKSVKGKFTLPRGWKVILKRPFLNGGIPVVAFVFDCQGHAKVAAKTSGSRQTS